MALLALLVFCRLVQSLEPDVAQGNLGVRIVGSSLQQTQDAYTWKLKRSHFLLLEFRLSSTSRAGRQGSAARRKALNLI